jgi:hypothetical protein
MDGPLRVKPVETCDGAHMTIIPLVKGDVAQCRRCGGVESVKTGKVTKKKVDPADRRGIQPSDCAESH